MRKVGEKSKSISDEIKFEKYTVEYDAFDIRNFERIRKKNPKLLQTYHEGTSTYPQFEELQQDVFDSLYKYHPELIDTNRVELSHKLNSQVMDAVLQSPKYKELRLMTKMDIVNATVGSEVLGEQVKKLVGDLQEQFKDAMDKAKQAQQAVNDAEDKNEQAEDGEKGNSTEAEAQQQLELEEAKKLLDEAMEEVATQLTKKESRQISRALDETIAETRETMNTITNWGLNQDPTYERKSHQEKVKLLNRIRSSRKLKALAEIAGRYKRMATTLRKEKIKRGSDEVFDTTYGDEIGKLMSSEMIKLLEPDLEVLFTKDLLEKQLLQYEYKGTEKKSKGPIVCCIDGSGSMGGSREIWAKAVALGLLDIAKGQKRSFVAIHFDSTRDPKKLHQNRFPKTQPVAFENVVNMAEYFPGGGTLFEPALDLSREIIMEDEDFSKADIIFITDGQSVVRDDWLEEYLQWKHEKNINIYSVLIDNYFNTDASINEFSDEIIKLSDLEKNKDDAAAEIFGII